TCRTLAGTGPPPVAGPASVLEDRGSWTGTTREFREQRRQHLARPVRRAAGPAVGRRRPPGAGAVRDQAGDRRPGPAGRADARLIAGPWARAARRRPRR